MTEMGMSKVPKRIWVTKEQADDAYETSDPEYIEYFRANMIPLADASRAADVATLLEAARKVLKDLDDLVSATDGVYGLAIENDRIPWQDILAGGEYDAWLRSQETLRAAIAKMGEKAQPPA